MELHTTHSQHKVRRSVIAAVAAVASAAVLTGCGSSGGTASESTSTEDWPDLSGQSIEVAAAWSGTEQSNFEQVLDEFESLTGATVTYSSYGDNMATTLNTKIAGGGAPDVAIVSSPALLKTLAQSGDLVAVSEETQELVSANYSSDWADMATVDGDLYGVWFKASNKSTVWYNVDVYDEAGVSAPTDWDGFLDTLQTLSDAGYYGISVGADAGWPLTDWFENVYLRTAGGDLYDQLSNHEIAWTDESVTVALQTLSELWSNDQIVQPGGDQRTWNESVAQVFGDTPAAGTVYEGDFVASEISDATSSVLGENALFYNFPSIDGSGDAVVGGGDVAVQLGDNDAAAALMQFLATPEAAEIWVQLGGFTSPNQAVDTSLYPDEITKQSAEALTNTETFRFDMSDLAPSEFGSTKGSGEWQILIEFYQDPSEDNIASIQQELEDAAAAATGWGN